MPPSENAERAPRGSGQPSSVNQRVWGQSGPGAGKDCPGPRMPSETLEFHRERNEGSLDAFEDAQDSLAWGHCRGPGPFLFPHITGF